MEKMRLLIADDNQGVRQDLRMILQLDGRVEVVGEAANGEEAVYLARQLLPDVVLMDLEMPVMDGLEATREIKQHQFARAVLILTVHCYETAHSRSLQSGADAFIVKGTPVDAMLELFEKVLEK
jgi:DNA-binding NarL/FixJ family response regulator